MVFNLQQTLLYTGTFQAKTSAARAAVSRLVPRPPPHHSADALGAGAVNDTNPPLNKAAAFRKWQLQQPELQQLHQFHRPPQAPSRPGSRRCCWGSPGQRLRRLSTAWHAGHQVILESVEMTMWEGRKLWEGRRWGGCPCGRMSLPY